MASSTGRREASRRKVHGSWAMDSEHRWQCGAHLIAPDPMAASWKSSSPAAMNNPVGLAFSEAGERFLSGTFFDLSASQGRRDGILHAVYGGDVWQGERSGSGSSIPAPATCCPSMAQMGPAAPSGIVMAREPCGLGRERRSASARTSTCGGSRAIRLARRTDRPFTAETEFVSGK